MLVQGSEYATPAQVRERLHDLERHDAMHGRDTIRASERAALLAALEPFALTHLTLTGPNAGTAACHAIAYELPAFGALQLPAGDRGVHYAHARPDQQAGAAAGMCPACVAAFAAAIAAE